MSSLGRITLTAGVILFVFFGLMTIVRSCNEENGEGGEIDLVESGEEYDIFSDGEAIDVVVPEPNGTDGDKVKETGSGDIDYTAVDEELEKPLSAAEEKQPIEVIKPKKRTTPTKTQKAPAKKSPKPAASGSSGGKYLVVAGSFAVRDNAVKSVKKLQSQGYSDAKVVQFDNQNLHVVCAYQSGDYDAAARIVKSLKAKGVDCFIKTRS